MPWVRPMQSWESRRPFPELVRADAAMREKLGAQLDEDTVDGLFDPAFYLRHEDEIYARVLGRTE